MALAQAFILLQPPQGEGGVTLGYEKYQAARQQDLPLLARGFSAAMVSVRESVIVPYINTSLRPTRLC